MFVLKLGFFLWYSALDVRTKSITCICNLVQLPPSPGIFSSATIYQQVMFYVFVLLLFT